MIFHDLVNLEKQYFRLVWASKKYLEVKKTLNLSLRNETLVPGGKTGHANFST